MKKSEVREMIVEEFGKLNEAKNYPSQEDAEAMAEWFNLMNEHYSGAASNEVKSAINKAESIRIKLHKKIFNDKSPWAIMSRRGKAEVVWDKDKAEALGL